MSLELHGTIERGEFSRHIDFSVNGGEVVAILGVNGSGKSTVLHTIAGLASLRDGALSIDGAEWDAPANNVWVSPEQRRCGVVFQDLRLFPHLDALHNVAFPLRAAGVSKKESLQRALDALTTVDARLLAPRRPASLSGGERQRVALARAFVMQPHVLLLDEPFSAVDEETHNRLRTSLPEFVRQAGMIALMVTHNEADASLMASHIVRL